MKAKLAALAALPLLAFACLSFAEDNLSASSAVYQEPVMLSLDEMDGVTAAGGYSSGGCCGGLIVIKTGDVNVLSGILSGNYLLNNILSGNNIAVLNLGLVKQY